MLRGVPGRYHFFKGDLRRANLKRFPYHFLYRVAGDCVRVLVVRHNRRHPDYGLKPGWGPEGPEES